MLCQCLTFLTISGMIICALGLAEEESTFWRFPLNRDSFRAGHWVQLSGPVMSLLFVVTFEHLPPSLLIYSWCNLKVCRPLFSKILIYLKYKFINMI